VDESRVDADTSVTESAALPEEKEFVKKKQ
jgi:hypothetical protein